MKKVILLIIATLLLLSGIWYIVNMFLADEETVMTDDAQVEQYISPVNAKVQGYIKEIRFTEHQYVHRGDILVLIDDTEYKLMVAQAQAMLEQAQAGVGTMNATMNTIDERVVTAQAGESMASAGIVSAQAVVDEARIAMENAEKDFERYSALIESKAITPQQFDKAQAAYEMAKSKYNNALAGLEAAKAQAGQASGNTRVTTSSRDEQSERIKQTAANTHAAQAQLDLAKVNLSYTVIKAPCDGWVGRRTIQVGQLVSPGVTLTTITPSSDKWIVANFKETQIERIRKGQEVEITIDAITDKVFKGKVTEISSATGSKFSVLPTDNSSGNFVKIQQRIPVRIDIDSLSAQDNARLAAGMMCVVKVRLK